MSLNGPYKCDFSGGRNLVEYSREDLNYFETLTRGQLTVTKEGVKFQSEDKELNIEKIGSLETVFENAVNGPLDDQNGVIGRVAREGNFNAVEVGSSAKLDEGAIDATCFRCYKVAK